VQIERGRTSWGFPARGAHHSLREDSSELRRSDFGNSRYWVFLAGVLALFLVVSGDISVAGLLVLRLVPEEVFPMCFPSLAHVGKSFGTLS
jgi:hypothetical protein